MNINEIKKQLNVETLNLFRVKDEQEQPTEWLANWNNDNRVRTVVHQDLIPTLGEDTTLFLKTEQKVAKESGEAYTLHIICRSTEEPEYSF